jgi:hypothetical protein
MRPGYHTITPSVVRQHVCDLLRQAYAWTSPVRQVSVDQLLQILLLAATAGKSVHNVVRHLFDFGLHQAYRVVHANCQSLDATATALNRALHALLAYSRLDRTVPCTIALDSHLVPYYGHRTKTPGLVGGQRKAGTKYFHGYATAVILQKRRRYTVALQPLLRGERPHELVRRLLDTVAAFGLSIRGVTADSGFDSAETLALLQQRKLAYAIPMRRKGRGPNARNRLFEHRSDTVHQTTWKADRSRQSVTTSVYVWRRKNSGKIMVVAFAGWTASQTRQRVSREVGRHARDVYRCRFGIETSYRQKNQGRAQTTSRNPVWHLWLEGIAQLIRQVWVLLSEQIAQARNYDDDTWVGELPLDKMIRWLDLALREGLDQPREVPLSPHTCG